MARIRTIKPEFQNSQDMGRVSRDARLTFIQLWPQCDDTGRLRANSRMLASVLFPYDEDAPKLIDGWLAELEKHGCIVRYSVANDEYLAICHWEHQKIDHPLPSKLPSPPAKKAKKTKLSSREKPANDSEASANARAVSSTLPDLTGSSFEAFWNACPKKTGQGAAEKAWAKAIQLASPETLIAAMRRYAKTQRGKDPAYIKTPGPWLNDKKWLDDGIVPVGPVLPPEELAALQDRTDKILKRGKYAESYQ